MLSKGVEETSAVREGYHDSAQTQQRGADQDGVIGPGHRPFAVPCPPFFFPEPAQVHRVGDQLDPPQRREYQRDRDLGQPGDPFSKRRFPRQVGAARLLCL